MKLYKVKKSKIDNFGLYASKDIKKDYLTIIHEIKEYDSNLSKKKQILVLTKCDAVEDKKS